MALNTLFWEIFIAMQCINGMIFVVDGLADTPLKTPFDTSGNVTAASQPNIFNFTDPTGTLVENMTTNVRNDTNNSLLNPLQDYFFYPLQLLWTVVQFITGGFVWEALTIFGLPDQFMYVLQGVIGTILILTLKYELTGR